MNKYTRTREKIKTKKDLKEQWKKESLKKNESLRSYSEMIG
ncbi:hypothetical protein LEP1GSC170_2944 [Leptospira interrogans serovar Bataviae str. HAI135]|nr:hypothetical protein LEP1GSC170_2944 [Leptospira interrogans serovar Bataviae str. HAI135]